MCMCHFFHSSKAKRHILMRCRLRLVCVCGLCDTYGLWSVLTSCRLLNLLCRGYTYLYHLVLPHHLAVPCCWKGALNTHGFVSTYLNCKNRKPDFSYCDSKRWGARNIALWLFLSFLNISSTHMCSVCLFTRALSCNHTFKACLMAESNNNSLVHHAELMLEGYMSLYLF